MAAPSETYVDPSIAGNSGAGTIGDPYGDLQYALNTMTRDATNGDRINILTGTDEVLTAALSLATYGTPSATAPLIFQGYASSAGDGGIGGISGAGSYSVFYSTSISHIHFVDMHLHNSGSATSILRTDTQTMLVRCEINNNAGWGVLIDNGAYIRECHIHDLSNGVRVGIGSAVMGCTFENDGTRDMATALLSDEGYNIFTQNVFDIDGATVGINGNFNDRITLNSVYSSAGTGTGIIIDANSIHECTGNIVEGFSGVGGVGISVTGQCFQYGYNLFYNNTTNENITGDIFLDLANDQTPGASPFTNAGSDDFTVGTSARALAYPTANYPSLSVRTYLDIGALQRQEPAGGGGTTGKQGLHPIEAGAV